MLLTVWAVVGVLLYVVFLGMLRLRMVPLIVSRCWFCVNLLFAVALGRCLCAIIALACRWSKLLTVSRQESWARVVCVLSFGYLFQFNCQHIRLEMMPGSLQWADITGQYCLCLNHASFFDTILFLWVVPHRTIYHIKSFVKSSLRKMPVFGSVIEACGHFPVHFTSTASHSFTVDKEKQAMVGINVDSFLNDGGSLCFFPEGALNATPEVLKEFRLGSFQTIVKRKLPLYYLITFGNHEVWPPRFSGLPGFPADIYVYCGKLDYDAETTDAPTLATALREEMQRHVDSMLALRKSRGYKPYLRQK